MRAHRWIPSLLLAPALAAQTFVVDANNGPGTNFTDLPTAVAAVPDGSVLVVRRANYNGFAMSGKGITILAEYLTMILGSVSIDSTAAHQDVTLRGLHWTQNPSYVGNDLLALTDCHGRVLLEACNSLSNYVCLPGQGFPCTSFAVGIRATRCDQLTLRDCSLQSTVSLTDCDTVIESTTILGESWSTPYGGRPALTIDDGWTTIAGSSVLRGGTGLVNATTSLPPASAIVDAGTSSHTRVLGGRVIAGLDLFQNVAPPPIVASYPVPVATRALLQTASGTVAGTDVMPQLTGSGGTPGGTLSATVATEPGDLVVLVVGIPGPAATMPGIQGRFWLDPVDHVYVVISTQTVAAAVTATVPVPAAAGYLGVKLNCQAACFGPVTGLQATNPVVALVR